MPTWGFPNSLGIVKGGMYRGYIGVYMDTKGQNCGYLFGGRYYTDSSILHISCQGLLIIKGDARSSDYSSCRAREDRGRLTAWQAGASTSTGASG